MKTLLALTAASLVAACTRFPAHLPPPPALPPGVHAAPPPPGSKALVLTQHNDVARTGANLAEVALTPDAIDRAKSPGAFRYLWPVPVVGQIYAQPLYVSDLEVCGKKRNVVFVATMHNDVYAIDADEPGGGTCNGQAYLWHAGPLGESLPQRFMKMDQDFWGLGLNIRDGIGITSTPVIDLAKKRLYVSAKVCKTGTNCTGEEHGTVAYRVAALDLATGTVLREKDLVADATNGVYDVALTGERIAFDPRLHLQRPGLLLSRGRLYLGFASHQDTSPFHGWLIALDADTLETREHVCTSCETTESEEMGIWQAGGGPAADDAGNVYVMTGNGPDEDKGGDNGSSFLKFSDDLRLLSRFSPAGAACLNAQDVDLGSAGPMLLPQTSFLLGGGKEGVLYLLNRDDLGGQQPDGVERYIGGTLISGIPLFQRPCPAQHGLGPPLQAFQAGSPWSNPFPGGSFLSDWPVATMGYHHIHGSPVTWTEHGKDPMVYVWPERDRVRGFRFDRRTSRFVDVAPPGREPTSTLAGPMSHKYGMPGAALSISANGDRDGVLWATRPLEHNALTATVAGVLQALDASTLRLLWDSRADGGVSFYFAKYASPTVAGGKVFVPTFSNRLDVYGLVTR
jgi:outer membrane protein assembly factor BamB